MSRIPSNPLMAAAVLTLIAATPVLAQKGHGGQEAHPMPPSHPMRAPHIEREADKGMRDADKAVRDAAHDAEHVRQDDKHMADRAREERAMHANGNDTRTPQRETKAEKALDRVEHRALKDARHDSKTIVRGLRLTDVQRAQGRTIDRKYDGQLKALEAEDRTNEKAGRPDDPALVAKINAIRDQERAEIRATLTPSQQLEFDRNLSRRH